MALVAGMCIAFMLDYIPGFLGYTLVFAIGGVAGLVDILLYVRVDFSSIPAKSEGFSLLRGIKDCFTSSKTRNYLIFWTFWSFVVNLKAPFINRYAIDVLELSFVSIIIFGSIVAQLITLFVVSRWGVFLDRYGSIPVLTVATIISSLGVTVWLFATPGNVVPVIAFNIVGGFFWCALDACSINMQITHTPTEGRPTTLAIFAVLTSGATAVALLAGGALLEFFSPIMERADLTFAGTPFDHFKLLFSIAILLRLCGSIFLLPKVWNEKEMSVREAFAMAYDETAYRIRYELSRIRIRRPKE